MSREHGFTRAEAMKGTNNSPWSNMYIGGNPCEAKKIRPFCGTCEHMSQGICKLTGEAAMLPCDKWEASLKLKKQKGLV